jgi:hypothetical protein
MKNFPASITMSMHCFTKIEGIFLATFTYLKTKGKGNKVIHGLAWSGTTWQRDHL